MGVMAIESVQRAVISGQAWGKSSKVVDPQKAPKTTKTLYGGIIKE
jgi:hypothetical protein